MTFEMYPKLLSHCISRRDVIPTRHNVCISRNNQAAMVQMEGSEAAMEAQMACWYETVIPSTEASANHSQALTFRATPSGSSKMRLMQAVSVELYSTILNHTTPM